MWGPRVILSLPSILIPLSLLSLSLLTPASWSPDSPSWASPPRPRRCPSVVQHRSRRRRRLHPPKPSSSPHLSPARARRRSAATTHSQVGCTGATYEADTVGAFSKLWGKPAVFRHDRMPMFGRGRVMAEGDKWACHRCIVVPAFSATNLNDTRRHRRCSVSGATWWRWDTAASTSRRVLSGTPPRSSPRPASASPPPPPRSSTKLQAMLFCSTRASRRRLARQPPLYPRHLHEAWKLGRKIDALLLDIIESRRQQEDETTTDLLSLLLAGNEASTATERKLTTALALSWTLLMLATHPEWQAAVREKVTGWSGPMDAVAMGKFTKMGCMLNEVLRLYPPSPNVQRPAACNADAKVVRGDRRNAAWELGISASQGREGESADTPSAAALALTRSPPPPLQHPSTSCPLPPRPKGKRKERDRRERERRKKDWRKMMTRGLHIYFLILMPHKRHVRLKPGQRRHVSAT
uniref:Cytochrome P450 n=1 Tax=Oryza meridionalis TaxID=40149 RepID=A0A0E0ET22_9ORYZ